MWLIDSLFGFWPVFSAGVIPAVVIGCLAIGVVPQIAFVKNRAVFVAKNMDTAFAFCPWGAFAEILNQWIHLRLGFRLALLFLVQNQWGRNRVSKKIVLHLLLVVSR
jgi:hypothetical protein